MLMRRMYPVGLFATMKNMIDVAAARLYLDDFKTG